MYKLLRLKYILVYDIFLSSLVNILEYIGVYESYI